MLPPHLRVFYLHGFASSCASRKARFFKDRLASLDVTLGIPDLCEGNFEGLTITGQLNVIERTARTCSANEPIVLIGSSLGGYLAALYAARHAAVSRLVLLAPAFQFHRLWTTELGPRRLQEWRENGTIPIFHHGEGREVPIGYQLMDDAGRHDPFPPFRQPALIFHGTQDAVVPVQYSVAFAEAHRNVRLVQVESGHELTDALDEIWRESRDFVLYGPSI